MQRQVKINKHHNVCIEYATYLYLQSRPPTPTLLPAPRFLPCLPPNFSQQHSTQSLFSQRRPSDSPPFTPTYQNLTINLHLHLPLPSPAQIKMFPTNK